MKKNSFLTCASTSLREFARHILVIQKKFAFSLVELLVTLIIISLITSALAPVITKKLKSNSVAVGAVVQDGTEEKKEEDKNKPFEGCAAGPSEECCAKFGAKYVSKESVTGYTSNIALCVSQYNAGDSFIELEEGGFYHPDYAKIQVKMLESGDTCDTGSCCWRGVSKGGTDLAEYNNYSANDRTVCNHTAAKRICANWAPPGSFSGSWRLPTQGELGMFASIINNEKSAETAYLSKYLNEKGLQLCDRSSTAYGSNKCPDNKKCPGGNTNSNCSPTGIYSQDGSYRLTNGVFEDFTLPLYGHSVRCVSEAPQIADPTEEYIPDSNEPASQADCPKETLFIESKYTGTKNICMFKYNAGETNLTNKEVDDFASKYGIQLLLGGQTCDLASDGMCCWYDGTGSDPSGNYYSGTNRIVCMHNAAKAICTNYNNKKGSWRLPTQAELISLAKYINAETKNSKFLSKYMDGEGLQLCDRASEAYGSNKCADTAKCPGNTNSTCSPTGIYSQTGSYRLTNGLFEDFTLPTYAHSVRCVTDNVKQSTTFPPRVTAENEPAKQEDCPSDTVFIPARYTGTTNLCMFRYNAGEVNLSNKEISDYASKYGIQIVPGGSTCNLNGSGMCCWYNSTGVASGMYYYSGANRIVCMHDAAKTVCDNYSNKKGKWRLPTHEELKSMAKWITASTYASPFLSKYVTDDLIGLQLCDRTSDAYGSNKCGDKAACLGAGNDNCSPTGFFSQTGSYYLKNGAVIDFGLPTYAQSVRCVTEDLGQREFSYVEIADEPENQSNCPDDSIFIDKQYTGSTNLCMFKYNAGDGNTRTVHPALMNGIDLNPTTSCTGDTCCWNDKTGTINASESYAYTGGTRTVCTKATAAKICAQAGEGWRLPTHGELEKLAPYITASSVVSPHLSKYLDDKAGVKTGGLQLCDRSSDAYGANKCADSAKCSGMTSNTCSPTGFFSQTGSYYLKNGAVIDFGLPTYAQSVRCVTSKAQN